MQTLSGAEQVEGFFNASGHEALPTEYSTDTSSSNHDSRVYTTAIDGTRTPGSPSSNHGPVRCQTEAELPSIFSFQRVEPLQTEDLPRPNASKIPSAGRLLSASARSAHDTKVEQEVLQHLRM